MDTLLIVDDSATDRTRLSGLLSKFRKWKVEGVCGGREALEFLKDNAVDLVLTDMQMPETNGLELVKEVSEQFPHVPVVLMTAEGSEELAVEAMHEGAASYVNKTTDAAELRQIISQVLASRTRAIAHSELMQHMKTDHYELVLPNDRVLMSATARFLRQAVQAVGLCERRELPRIGIALEEALLNACLHGNLSLDSTLRESGNGEFDQLARQRSGSEPWSSRRVCINADITPDELRVEIKDEGDGFDPAQLPDPTDPENLLKPHGRGVMMMKMFLDNVTWNEKGNSVTLIKRRK